MSCWRNNYSPRLLPFNGFFRVKMAANLTLSPHYPEEGENIRSQDGDGTVNANAKTLNLKNNYDESDEMAISRWATQLGR
jgi:hypothetical protein